MSSIHNTYASCCMTMGIPEDKVGKLTRYPAREAALRSEDTPAHIRDGKTGSPRTIAPKRCLLVPIGEAVVVALALGLGFLLYSGGVSSAAESRSDLSLDQFSDGGESIADIAPGDIIAAASFDVFGLRKGFNQALAENVSSASRSGDPLIVGARWTNVILPGIAGELGVKPEAIEEYLKSVGRANVLIGGDVIQARSAPDTAFVLQGPSEASTRSFLDSVSKGGAVEVKELEGRGNRAFTLGYRYLSVHMTFRDGVVIASNSLEFMDRLATRLDPEERGKSGPSLADRLDESGVPQNARHPETMLGWQYMNVPELYAQMPEIDRLKSDVLLGAGGFELLIACQGSGGMRVHMPMAKDNPWRTLFMGSDFQHSGPRALSGASGLPRPMASLSLGVADAKQFMIDYGLRLIRLKGNSGRFWVEAAIATLIGQAGVRSVEERLGGSLFELLGNTRELAVSVMPFEPGIYSIDPKIALVSALVFTCRMANPSALDSIRSPQTGQPLFSVPGSSGLREASLMIPDIPLPLSLMARGDMFSVAIKPDMARRALGEADSPSSTGSEASVLAMLDLAELVRLGLDTVVLHNFLSMAPPLDWSFLLRKIMSSDPKAIAGLPRVTSRLTIDAMGLSFESDLPGDLVFKIMAALYSADDKQTEQDAD